MSKRRHGDIEAELWAAADLAASSVFREMKVPQAAMQQSRVFGSR
jgi:hypothetical protein